MMKFWLSIGPMLNCPNPHRIIPSHTLYIRYINSILVSHPHLPRCQLWPTNLLSTCSRCLRSLYSLRLPNPPRRGRNLLWLLSHNRNLKHRNRTPICHNSNNIRKLCYPMRTNTFLRGYSNHKSPINHPLHRYNPSRMNLRWIFSRQNHFYTILCIPLHPTFHHYSPRQPVEDPFIIIRQIPSIGYFAIIVIFISIAGIIENNFLDLD
ncbi:hypothetical protein U0070_024531 [Myodes glareolus]|uniref:Cytochrome b n=1 Tax=Myodes glareolus TaxID=447135 RepID=A0AAW0HKE2_MYOGA